MRWRPALSSNPTWIKSHNFAVKSHNFAIFCFFGGTRKIVYAKVHWIFQNPPRKTQSHQNSDFLGKIKLVIVNK